MITTLESPNKTTLNQDKPSIVGEKSYPPVLEVQAAPHDCEDYSNLFNRQIRNLQKSEVSSPWHAAADAFSLNLPTFEEKVE